MSGSSASSGPMQDQVPSQGTTGSTSQNNQYTSPYQASAYNQPAFGYGPQPYQMYQQPYIAPQQPYGMQPYQPYGQPMGQLNPFGGVGPVGPKTSYAVQEGPSMGRPRQPEGRPYVGPMCPCQ